MALSCRQEIIAESSVTLLITGLVLFFVLHLIPCAPDVKSRLIAKTSATGYRIAFNLLSVVAIILVVAGLKRVDFVELYQPPVWGRSLALILMLPAIYLFFSNSVGPAPSSAQAVTAHPMNWGIVVWSIAHLLANGDLAHVMLFVTFGVFSVVSMVSANARGAKPKREQRPPFKQEAVFLLIVVFVYAGLLWAHPYFTGVSLLSL